MGVTSCFCHTIYKKVELVKLNVAAERNPAGNGFLSLPVWWFLPSVMEFVRFSPAQWNQDVSWRHEAASINSGTTRTRLPVQTLTGTDTSCRQWKEVSDENRASGETHSIWDACSVQWPRRRPACVFELPSPLFQTALACWRWKLPRGKLTLTADDHERRLLLLTSDGLTEIDHLPQSRIWSSAVTSSVFFPAAFWSTKIVTTNLKIK